MRYIAYFSLDGFYSRSQVEGPAVIQRDEVVLDANPEARSRGISLGMSVRQTRALVDALGVFAWREEDFEAQQREWLDLLVPLSDGIEPDEQHAAWVDLSAHPAPHEIAQLALAKLAPLDMHVRMGCSPVKWIAKVAARVPYSPLAFSDPAAFIADLDLSVLPGIDRALADLLRALGCATVRSLRWIDDSALHAQLGAQFWPVREHMWARGGEEVAAQYPPQSMSRSFTFESPVYDSMALLAGVLHLANEIGAELRAGDHVAEDATLHWMTESCAMHQQHRVFAKPLCDERTTFAAMRLLLPHEIAEGDGISQIRLRLGDVRKRKEHQIDLAGRTDRAIREVAVTQAISRMNEMFGDTSVRCGSEVPVERSKKLLQVWEHVLGF